MITVPQATKKIIERSRYLSEAIAKDIINLSSLARYIKPEIDEMLIKNVSEASIIMALKRLSSNLKPPVYKNLFLNPPDIILHSNLLHMTVINSQKSPQKNQELQQFCVDQQKYFLAVTGITESTIITSRSLDKELSNNFSEEKILTKHTNVSAIVIKLAEDILQMSGIFYFLLKSLAWEEITITEAISNHNEFTLILNDEDSDRALTILKSIFS